MERHAIVVNALATHREKVNRGRVRRSSAVGSFAAAQSRQRRDFSETFATQEEDCVNSGKFLELFQIF
jgi:hypothetical protein